MPNKIEGHFIASKNARFALVVARWNSLITDRLAAGATDALVRHGVTEKNIDAVYVPGAFELPLALKKVVHSKEKYAAVIALGCVIRGGTPHFEYVAGEASKGIAQVAFDAPIPVAFGLLTCDTLEQALDRAGAKAGNKGWEAAMSALEMTNLLRKL